MSVVLREMDGLERNREEKKTTQPKRMDGWTGFGGDEMDKVKTLAEKLDRSWTPCIVGDIGTFSYLARAYLQSTTYSAYLGPHLS
jgi:hypothetical protein